MAEFVAVTGVRDPSAITTLGGVRVDMPSPLDARADCLAGEMADHRTLALVGLASRATARCHELSSAERWRLAIAHSLSTGRSPLVIDGTIPFASQAELVTLALGLRHAGITVYVVTNDDRLAGSADRVVSASPGRSTAGPPSASTLDRARIIHELLRSVT